MRVFFRTTALAGLVMGLGALTATQALAADLKVGFITSLSGPVSSLGIPYEKGMKAAYAYKSESGGHKIQLIQLDDASDPTTAARNARKMIDEDKVDIIIGTAGSPGALAIAAVARETKTPLISIANAKLDGEEGAWMITLPQPAPLMASALIERMKKSGVKTLGYIGFSDAWGDLVYAGGKAAEDRGEIKLLTNERYARTDTSVTAQILRVLATKPDGVLIGGSSTQAALPLISLAERGYKGPTYGLASLINPDFVRVGGKAVEGVQVSAGPVIVSEQLPDGHFSKQLSADFRKAYKEANDSESRDGFSAYSFDAYLVFAGAAERALGKAKPGTAEFRKALRDEMLATKELAGVHGVYNYKPGQGYGVDERSLVIVQLKDGKWVYTP